MRVYVATSVVKLKEFLDAGQATFDDYLTPAQFDFDANVDDEEQEHLISQLAADDSFELNGGKFAYVLALDLNDSQLNGDVINVDLKQVAALLRAEDGEELSWFAPEELKFQIDGWMNIQ